MVSLGSIFHTSCTSIQRSPCSTIGSSCIIPCVYISRNTVTNLLVACRRPEVIGRTREEVKRYVASIVEMNGPTGRTTASNSPIIHHSYSSIMWSCIVVLSSEATQLVAGLSTYNSSISLCSFIHAIWGDTHAVV